MSTAAADDDVICIHFTLLFADYLRMYWVATRRVLVWMVGPILLGIGLWAIVPNSGFFEFVAEHWPYLLLAAALPLLTFPLNYWRIRRRWQLYPDLRAPKTYKFMREGLHATLSWGEESISWVNIRRVQRSGPVLLLALSQVIYIIPIRAFRDRDQWERFRRLIETAAPGARLPPSSRLKFADNVLPVTVEAPAEIPAPMAANVPDASATVDPGVDEPIRIRITPTVAGYIRLQLPVFPWRIIQADIIIIGVGVVLLLDIDSGVQFSPYIIWGFVVTSVMLINLAIFGTLLQLALRWAWSNELREPRTFSFSAGQIEIAATTFASTVDWKFIVKAFRCRAHVLLQTPQKRYFVLPRAAFSDEDWDRFRRLVESKVADCKLGR